jgi:hypothetical protein
MPEFTNFAALVRQAMPNHISEAQADAFARQPVTREPGTTTWGQLFEETMSSRSAHIEGAANIYYSQNITADGHLVRSNEVAEALVEHSGGRLTTLERTPLGELLDSEAFVRTLTTEINNTFDRLGLSPFTDGEVLRSPVDSIENAFFRGASERFSSSAPGIQLLYR